MKRFLFLILALGMSVSIFAQFGATKQRNTNVIAPMHKTTNIDLPVVGQLPPNTIVSNKSILDDPISSVTRYDLQSNSSSSNRLYLYDDGTVGTTATWSTQDASWTDRGTGYNYWDGSAFGSLPTARTESMRSGWPSYCPFGATGEMTIAHQSAGPLIMCSRPVKGTGAWTTTTLPALPATIPVILWPRVVTNGPTHNYIHVIALTGPTANSGTVYNGMNGALLYSRSLDGGITFSAWTQLTGMTSTEYTSFTADVYAWAWPKGDTLAFTTGDSWQDQFLMKSNDNGATWTKTVIYNSPYNLGGNSPGFFFCPDGTMGCALDNQGVAHVVFGLQADSGSPTAGYFRPYTQGVVYWNEHMTALDPSLDPDILYPNHQFIGWVKDTMVFYPPTGVTLGYYYTSLTDEPSLVIDKNNKVFLSFAGATTLVDPNSYTLRHLFGRDGYIDGDTIMWHNDTLVDITGDWIQYNFAECYYPSASPTSDEAYVYYLFQRDDYGGSYVKGLNISPYNGQTSPDDNSITMIKWEKPLWVGVNDKHEKLTFNISQNYPNPVNGMTTVKVYTQNSGDLSLKVTNLTGQSLMTMEKTNVLAGVQIFNIDASQLPSGIYFYSVKQGEKSITKKMIVQ
ncbi:MAG: T9SS type A sorting domain-containing protein [Bacteroidetes bacterium]|nr:T9SS type A sorting domain-containing protein [Bacteroidota bacterium]